MHYNPFHYLHSETDILSLVTVIMENTPVSYTHLGAARLRKGLAFLLGLAEHKTTVASDA